MERKLGLSISWNYLWISRN